MRFLKKFNKTNFIATLLLSWSFVPFSLHAMILDKVVAKVNSEIITLSFVEERAGILRQKYASISENPSEDDLFKEALNMLIDETLQIQEGKKIGFIIDEDAVDAAVEEIKNKNNIGDEQLQIMLEREGRSLDSYKNHIRDQILISKISRFEIGNRVKISEKRIIEYYKQHRKDLWQDGKVKARHILFIAERGSSEKIRREKFELAKNVLNEIRRGNDFAELAKEYSEDVSASNGGDVGYVQRGQMVPEFEEVVFRLKPGKVSDIVETEYGYHIIKVEEILSGKTLTFKDSKERIYQILSVEKQKQAYDDWMKELKETAYIEVTLFDDTEQNVSLISKNTEKKNKRTSTKRKSKPRSKPPSQKKDLQKTWEEMYKSVEKSKSDARSDRGSKLGSLEQKLKHLKGLRDRKKISEQEYQKRKGRLLNNL
jgi:peptidyl-prolyl cis-trans isomerase SurA